MVSIECFKCKHKEVTEVRKIRFDDSFLFVCSKCDSTKILITHVKENE